MNIDFIVCNTGRSGTNLLRRYLNECFDGIQGVTEWYDVSSTPNSNNVLDRCIRLGSKQIGTIVHYTFWERFLEKLSDHNYEICLETKFIHLTRLDKIRQSISELIATQKFNGQELMYDEDKISKYIRNFCVAEHKWREYFKSHSIFPLHITYEDLDRDPKVTLEKVAVYLKAQLNLSDKLIEIKSIGRRSNEINDLWVRKFCNEV